MNLTSLAISAGYFCCDGNQAFLSLQEQEELLHSVYDQATSTAALSYWNLLRKTIIDSETFYVYFIKLSRSILVSTDRIYRS